MLGGWATQGNGLFDLQRLAAEEPGTFLRQDGDSMWLVHVRVGWVEVIVLFPLPISLRFPYLSHKVPGKGWEQEIKGWALPMIFWMWTGCCSTAGGPAPAELTAATRRKNLSSRARFRMVSWVTIRGRAFTGTHSEPGEMDSMQGPGFTAMGILLSRAFLLPGDLGQWTSHPGPYLPLALLP